MKSFFWRSLLESYRYHVLEWFGGAILLTLAIPYGLYYAGMNHSIVSVRYIQILTIMILLSLVLPGIPLFRRAGQRDNHELVFLSHQVQVSLLHRVSEWAGEVTLPLLVLTGGALIDFGLNYYLGSSLRATAYLWGTTAGLVVVLHAVGTGLSHLLVSRFQALIGLVVSWIVMVVVYDLFLALLLWLLPINWITNILICLNPLDLFRLTLYRLIPGLSPAAQFALPGITVIAGGWVLWLLILLPIGLFYRKSSH